MNDRKRFYVGLGLSALAYEVINKFNSIEAELYDLRARQNDMRSAVDTNTSDIFELKEVVDGE